MPEKPVPFHAVTMQFTLKHCAILGASEGQLGLAEVTLGHISKKPTAGY